VLAQGFDRMLEVNFPLVQAMSNCVFNWSAIMPAVTAPNILPSSPVLTCKTAMSLEMLLDKLGHGVEFVRLAFAAALLERFDAALVGGGQRDGQALRKR
jgi:hypothetical protein